MQVFIDEAGKFTTIDGWSVVCSLAMPAKEVPIARRDLLSLTRTWPRVNGELKGGSLSGQQLRELVATLLPRDALFHAAAIDMSMEEETTITSFQKEQAVGMVKYLEPQRDAYLYKIFSNLSKNLDKMPQQLFVQSYLMRHLVSVTIERSTMYFAQRRPRELAKFLWLIDAKDPRRITSQEEWWVETLGPFMEGYAKRTPMNIVQDTEFNYSYFNKSYKLDKIRTNPDGHQEHLTGYNVGKLMTESISFSDSRSDILLQAIDILSNFLRRILNDKIKDPDVAESLGRLQICYSPTPGLIQNIDILTFNRVTTRIRTEKSKLLGIMARTGRSMGLRDSLTLG